MKWNIAKTGTQPPVSTTANPITTRKWNIPTSANIVPISTSTWQKTLIPSAQEKAVPNASSSLYNPAVIPTFNKQGKLVKDVGKYKKGLLTGLDYFNRYTETALGTLGALTETYTGFALNKDTWSIAKQKIANTYSQIWSPEALTDEGVPAAVGRAVGNMLSLAGEAIVVWQMASAVKQTAQQLKVTNQRIWAMEKVDKVLTAVDDLKSRMTVAETENVGKTIAVMPESKSYSTLISSVAEASKNPTQATMGKMMEDYAVALQKSTVVPSTTGALPSQASTTTPPSTSAILKAAETLASPATQTNLGAFIKTLPADMIPGIAPIPSAVPVGQPSTVAKPVTSLAEIPKAVPVGQPQTVSGGVKPTVPTVHRYQIPARTSTTPQTSPSAAISERETSVPTPPVETAPQIAQNAWESGVSWTTERVVSAIRSGKGLIPEEVLVQFATDHPDGVESGGKLIKVVVPVSAEGQSWSPRVVKVVQADGTLDFPAVKEVAAPSPVAEVAPTPHVMRAVDAPTGYRGPLDYSEPPVSKMEIPAAVPNDYTERNDVQDRVRAIAFADPAYKKAQAALDVAQATYDRARRIVEMGTFDKKENRAWVEQHGGPVGVTEIVLNRDKTINPLRDNAVSLWSSAFDRALDADYVSSLTTSTEQSSVVPAPTGVTVPVVAPVVVIPKGVVHYTWPFMEKYIIGVDAKGRVLQSIPVKDVGEAQDKLHILNKQIKREWTGTMLVDNLEAGDLFRYKKDGPLHRVTAILGGKTSRVRETSIEGGQISEIVGNTPVVYAEQSSVVPAWGKWQEHTQSVVHTIVGTGGTKTVVTKAEYRVGKGRQTFQVRLSSDPSTTVPLQGQPIELKGDVRQYAVVSTQELPGVKEKYGLIDVQSGALLTSDSSVNRVVLGGVAIKEARGEGWNAAIEAFGQKYGVITNTAPLPAGLTSSGEAVTSAYTSNEPSLATSGTSQTIPADDESIGRITVAFNKLADAKKSGGIKKTDVDAFYQAMVEAKVPKDAIHWKGYHKIEKVKSPEKQRALVADAVQKYNDKILAGQMAKGREHAQAMDRQQERLLKVRRTAQDKLRQSQKDASARLTKQQRDDAYLRDSAVARQKHLDRAIAAALAEKELTMAKTADYLKAEKDLSAKNKKEIYAIMDYLTNLDLRNMNAAEAKEIQQTVAGVVELKRPFVKAGDTAFAWLMQGKGIHVVDASIPVTEQKTLNLPELRSLQKKVKALADLSTEERDSIRAKERAIVDKAIDDCVVELSKHLTEKKIPGVRKGIYHGPEKKSRTRSALDKFHAIPVYADIEFDRQAIFLKILGGYREGALWDNLYNNIYAADRITARSVNTEMALAHERLVSLGITAKTMGKQRTLPNGTVVTQREVFLAAVYAGNSDTLEKLIRGNGWSEEEIRLAIESMSKEEVAWTNYMLDDMRLCYPLISDAYARTNQGASLPDVMNYFPAISQKGIDVYLGQEGKTSAHPAEQMTLDSLSFYGWGQGETSGGGKPSFVKQRSGGPQVLQIDPVRTYFAYKESVLDYINRAPVTAHMRAIVNDSRFRDAFIEVAGEQRYQGLTGKGGLVEYVNAVSNPQKALAPKNDVERVARILRWNGSAGTLGARLSKAATAFMSYGLGWGRYGPSAMAYGTYKLLTDFHGTMAEIKQYAPILFQRLADPARWDALVADAERAWGGNTPVDVKKLTNLGFAVGDTCDVAASFMGATWALLRQHSNDPEWTMERASYIIEQDILQTHTSRLVQDRPPIYRQTELGQAIVAFTGEATSQSMALLYDAKSAFHGKTPKAKFIAEWFTLTMGVALIGMAADAIANGRKKKKTMGFWDGIWGRYILANIELMVPLAGRWITGSIRGFTGTNDIITLKAIDEAKQAIADVVKGFKGNPANFGKSVGHILRFVGYGAGIPVLGYDEFMNWVKPDNPAPNSSSGSPEYPTMPSLPKSPKP